MGIYPRNKFRYLTCEISVFFSPEILLHNYKCGGCIPCCVTANTHTIVNWKNFAKCHWRLWHINQHDVIWRLPVWNVKIRRHLASCMLQFWSNLTKISFQGKHFNYFCVEKLVIFCKVEWTCGISSFQRFFFKIPCFYLKNCKKATWDFRPLLIC
jgi:hypothetical protein